MTNLGEDEELTSHGTTAKREIETYMLEAIARLTDEPDDSGLAQMIHSNLAGRPPRTYEDLIGSIKVIVLGGLQEPGHGAAASLYGLLSEPDQLAATLADPETLIGAAVHEGLRWIAPFGVTGRRAVVDIELGGAMIPAGARVGLACGSANHDETRYEHGERFDIFRPRQTHAAFGWGAHFCSGHFISRQLERIALEEVLSCLPGLRLDPNNPPEVRGFAVRGVKRLPVVWDV